jgi:hypothetical protein
MAGFAQCSHIFGVSSTVANAPIFQDEQTLLLAAGGQMVRYRLDDMPQKFVANHNQQTNKGIVIFFKKMTENHYFQIKK